MQIIDNIIILLLVIGAFLGGICISNYYHRVIESHLDYALKILSTEKGLGYIAPPEAKKVVPIGQPFMDKLKEHGRATQALRSAKT